MQPVSAKRRARLNEVRDFREALVREAAGCEWCARRRNDLCCHEIARGADRQKSLDCRFAILVLCQDCHRETDRIPRAGQLAVLYLVRPDDYDLAAYHRLICRVHPDQAEVDLWLRRLSKAS